MGLASTAGFRKATPAADKSATIPLIRRNVHTAWLIPLFGSAMAALWFISTMLYMPGV